MGGNEPLAVSSVMRKITHRSDNPNQHCQQPQISASPLSAGENDYTPNSIYREEERKDRDNRKSPNKRLARLRMQPLLFWYRPTERRKTYIDNRADEIECEQGIIP